MTNASWDQELLLELGGTVSEDLVGLLKGNNGKLVFPTPAHMPGVASCVSVGGCVMGGG